jgi:hypothetical protein
MCLADISPTDNVDYNELKQLIKERTSNLQTSPVSIPGQGSSTDVWADFEEELFAILGDQHERVSLFTKSKYGEIQRRLAQVERSLRFMKERDAGTAPSRRPVRQTRRFFTLVQDSQDIGDDIQALTRYINVQRLAFKKILKKHRRWTGSAGLQIRMNNQVFEQSDSFLQVDLLPLMDRLSNVTGPLTDLSKAKRQGRPATDTLDPVKPSDKPPAAQMHEAAIKESNVDLSAAFKAVPLGPTAGRVCYWIHPDNIDEAVVLVLRHMRACNALSQAPASSRPWHHSTLFDNIQRFVHEESAATIGQTEEAEGSVASKVPLSILWAEDEPLAAVISSDLSPHGHVRNRCMRVGHLKRKDLAKSITGRESKTGEARRLAEYLALHRDLKPLVEIQSRRTHFAGLNNSSEVGTWAILDRDIIMSPADVGRLGGPNNGDAGGDDLSQSASSGQSFPHAVLQIRWEFSRVPEAVRIFDSTHVAERVRGFSLETEALYTIRTPQDMAQPLWHPILSQDIRKIPPTRSRASTRRTKSGRTSPTTPTQISSGPSSTEGASGSVFSTMRFESSATSVLVSDFPSADPSSPIVSKPPAEAEVNDHFPKQKQKQVVVIKAEPTIQRYWNEFDDGEEFAEESGYAIYVNPDEPVTIPGTETVSKAFSAMYDSFSKGKSKIFSWLPLQSKFEESTERDPLFIGQPKPRYLEDSSDSETKVANAKSFRRARHSSRGRAATGSRALSNSSLRQRRRRKAHEIGIFRAYVTAFVIAYGLLVLSAVLQATGQQKSRVEVDAGVVVGVVSSLFCGIGAVGLMVTRKDRLSVLHKVAVFLAFCVVCAGSGYLLTVIGQAHWG